MRIPTLPPAHLEIPAPLGRLVDLAYNLWWTWHRPPRRLFERIDPDLWSRYRNPVRVLLHAHRSRLDELARDQAFLAELEALAVTFDAAVRPREEDVAPVAYVSAEYALHESLPIYSGGLGVLSGDHLKEASDLGLPLIGLGLFYRRGYFRQIVDAEGTQQHFFPDLDAYRLPLLRVAGPDGRSLRVPITLAGRSVLLRVWVAFVGRVPLLLLDSFTSRNLPEDRYITSQLYVRGREMRLAQEVVLGRGAVAILAALGIRPRLIHMNEGHSAFLALESLVSEGAGRSLPEAVEAARPRHVFTTHTPVSAGNEVFTPEQVLPYLADTARQLGLPADALLELGRADQAPGFNLTAVALRLSARANAVSQLHAEVSRRMWGGFPISAITNGVHVASWLGREMSMVLGGDEAADAEELARRAAALSDEALWAAHVGQKHRLMRFVRFRALRQFARHGESPDTLRQVGSLMNPNALTLGFARRFAAYKRADLLFHDTERLCQLLRHPERPVQLVIAGKAHPADGQGQALIRQVWQLSRRPGLADRIAFVEDYDMAVARLMVRGVDVWLNTPEWPREASGTSGMKAAANGVLHASVPDGWWAEAQGPELGFTLGEPGPPDRERDARLLLGLLDERIVPLYYDRGPDGLPRRWIAMMRASMAAFLYRFSTRRMLRQYARELYELG